VTDLTTDLTESGKARIQQALNDLEEMLIHIKNDVATENMDISQCVDDCEGQLNVLKDQLNKNMMVCLTNLGHEVWFTK
jgi:hypothetical protein